jgi:HEPN domain-containing protein
MTPQREEALKFLELAEQDRVAFRILAASTESSLAVVGFHAQQAVEKALKAVLIDRGVEFRRTHDLQTLADTLTSDLGLQLPVHEAQLRRLIPFAVEARYQVIEDLIIGREELANAMNVLLDWAYATVTGRSLER